MSGEVTELRELDIDDLPMEGLPFAVDDMSVAFHLGFKTRTLWWLILKPEAAYKVFHIPKASGGVRQIHAPEPAMKLMLKNMRKKFLVPQAEMLGDHVTAYRTGRNVVDAVKQHIKPCAVCEEHEVEHTCEPVLSNDGAKYRFERKKCRACGTPPKHPNCPRRGVKIHLDLKDFFSNTRAPWIREYLEKEAGYNEEASKVLAAAMTVKMPVKHGDRTVEIRGAPQGAPTSGDICNLVADQRLDRFIKAAVEKDGWVYTRYADDLYLSHPKSLPSEAVDELIERITKCIENAGWRNNSKKLEIQRPRWNQRLLGITLNQKPNIPIQQFRRVRCIVHRCWRDGISAEAPRQEKTPGQLVSWLNGVLGWFAAINPNKAHQLKAILQLAVEKHGVEQSN